MKNKFFALAVILISFNLSAQRGKDGAGNITVAGTVVNIYKALTANANAGNTSISVTNTTGLSVGDLVFIIQMQGASVNAGRDSLYPDLNSSIPTNTTYGGVTAYNNAGNYEFAQVNSLPNNTTINLDCGLSKNYSYLGKVQVIRVPRYTSLSVSGAGFITCPQWNASTGGVVVVEVLNNATLSSVPSFNVSGLGFRGGTAETVTLPLVTFGNKWGHVSRSEGGYKGESINGDTTRYQVYSAQHCKGAMANGGGGGDVHNAGGGGGSNAGSLSAYTGLGNPQAGYNTQWNLEFAGFAGSTSSGGGRGGYSWSNSNQNVNTVAPGSGSWGGDNRRIMGGVGGWPLDYSLGKLFIGGGGGAGHGNDARAGSGGNGGGLVYMLCYGNVSGAGTILANGANGFNTITSCATNDGGGGAGGGGTIILDVTGGTTLTAGTALSARGGNGGNCSFNCFFSNSNSYGPGGGGGGGYIGVTGTLPLNSVAGGTNGIQTGNNNNIGNGFPPNGATAGGTGSTATIPANPTITVNNATICTNNSATLVATSGTSAINWYNASAGGSAIGTGTQFVTSTYTTAGTYTLFAGACPGSYRAPVIITVNNGPTVTVNSATICTGQSAVLTASGAATYSWNTGPTTVSISVSPSVTTSYTVTGSLAGCSAPAISTITVTPVGTISVNSATVCSGQTATLTAGPATTYTWSTGSNNQSVAVSPTASAIYTINATSSGCGLTNTTAVTVNSNPTLSVANASVCSGTPTVLIASGATSYSWSTGATTSSISVSPSVSTIYTVNGTTGLCADSKTVSLTVNPSPTVSVNSATICSGNSATLNASGATTYSWSTGATSSGITPGPSVTTVYTVTGASSGCSVSITSTVSVVQTPTISVNSPSLCSGNSATLNASGAGTYSWSTGGSTSSISVTPSVTTVYTVTGTNGGICSSSNSSTVSVTPQPSVSLNANSFNICGAQSASIMATSSSGTYSWNTGATTSSIVVTPTVITIYTIVVTNICGSVSETATVTPGAPPSFTINPASTVICESQTISLNTAGSSGTFIWTGPGIISGSNTANPIVNQGGVYTATLTNSCGTATASVNITDGPSTSLNLGASSNTICSGGSVTLTAAASGTVNWSTGATNVSSVTVTSTGVITATLTNSCGSNTSSINIINGPAPTLTVVPSQADLCSGQTATLTANGSAGSYSWVNGPSGNIFTTTSAGIFTAVVTNSCGTGTGTFNVVFQSMPEVTLTANKEIICPNETATLTASGINGGTVYSWSSSPSNTSNIETVSMAGNYIVTYTNGCGSGMDSVTIAQSYLLPDFSFSPNGGNAPVTISFTNTSVNSSILQWNFGNGQTASGVVENSPYSSPGIYTVTLIVQNSDGCLDTISKTFEITDTGLGIVPEVITPNGDGKNDVFEIKGIDKYPDNRLQIFNRWGNLVHKINSYINTWDGTSDSGGGKLPPGTYFYILELGDSGNQVFRGFVQLMY